MTLLSPPGYLQAGTYSALLDRMYDGTISTVRSFGLEIGSRRGFLPSRQPTFSVVSGMDVVFSSCAGVIANTFTTAGGDYKFANPDNIQVTLAGSSPTLNRHDIIGIQVKDNFYDSSGQNEVIPVVLQGTESAGTPSDPAWPPSFIPVCRAVVSAGATSPTLQSMITRTSHDGGLLPIDSDSERAGIGTPYVGMPIIRTDRWGEIQMWTGGAWVTTPHPSYLHMRQTSVQSIPTNSWTSLFFQAEDLDNFAMHSGTSSIATCQRDGVYLLNGGYAGAVNATGSRGVRWALNGGAILGSGIGARAFDFVGGNIAARPMLVRLVEGDQVQLQVYQNTGGNLATLVTAENQCTMSLLWVAA